LSSLPDQIKASNQAATAHRESGLRIRQRPTGAHPRCSLRRRGRHPLRIYYAFILANLSFARERPEFYTEADLEEWQARERHAESLVEALECQDETCDIRAAAGSSKRVWVNGLRYQCTGR